MYIFLFFLGEYERFIFSTKFYKWRNNICISRKSKKNCLIIKQNKVKYINPGLNNLL